MKRLFLIFIITGNILFAQHPMQMEGDTMKMGKDSMLMPPMSHAFSLNLPMSRNGSGTGWSPDSIPMFGYMLHSKKWMFMIHGNVFLRYNKQDIFNSGSRGAEKSDAINWFMFMGQRKIGQRGLFHFSSMLSLDNLFGGNGYPLLFQTGETWQNKPLVDRQHPHDLFSELSVSYVYAINKKTDVFIYAGYPGEPALGSVAFMHRVSSFYNPDAPLSHHWNDGTHITFGVLTIGVRSGKFKLEGSSFTGREPDDNRYNFDKPHFDSYSGRISFNANAYWSFQFSEGFIKSQEVLHPSENICRSTASIAFSHPVTTNKFFNVSALWGLNNGQNKENAILTEASLVLNRFVIYSRYEYIEKSSVELNLNERMNETNALFLINAITLGASYDVLHSKFLNMAIGAQGTFYFTEHRLNSLYGKNPVSAEVYLRIYPPRIRIR